MRYIVLIKLKHYSNTNGIIKTSYFIGSYESMVDAANDVEDIWGQDIVSCEFEFLNDGMLCEVPSTAIEEIRQLNEIC